MQLIEREMGYLVCNSTTIYGNLTAHALSTESTALLELPLHIGTLICEDLIMTEAHVFLLFLCILLLLSTGQKQYLLTLDCWKLSFVLCSESVVRYSLSIWVLEFGMGIGLLICYVSSNLQLLNVLSALESPHLYVLLWN